MMNFWFFLAMVGKLGDLLTTIYFVERWGSRLEGNPFMRWAIEKWGLSNAMVMNFMLFFCCVLMTIDDSKSHFVKFAAIAMFVVVIWNLVGIYIRHKSGT